MKIMIIGGGIGGLTTALACNLFNLEYEIFESAPEIREVGAGIWVPPNAMNVMNRLGMAAAIQDAGKVLRKICVGGDKGKVWYGMNADKVIKKFGFGTIAIHRGRLQALLYDALDKSRIHTGKRLKQVVQEGQRVKAQFEDGSVYEGDCLIGADGIHSVTRSALFGELPLRYSGQTCWRGVVRYQLPEDIRHNMYELWGNLPGQRFAYSQISDDAVYYYATLGVPSGGKDDPGKVKDILHKHFDCFGPLVQSLIGTLDPASILRTDLYDLKPIKQWIKDKVALAGDAAHATTPNMGQGAAQAIEDAYVIAYYLDKYRDNIPLAFASYQNKRFNKARFIVNTSWQMGQLTNLGNPIAVKARNWLIRNTPGFIADKQIEKAYALNF